jgi:hypothetical protein
MTLTALSKGRPSRPGTTRQCCRSGSAWIERKDSHPDPYQSDKQDPVSHQFADYKQKCIEYEPLSTFVKVLSLYLEARIRIQILIRIRINVKGRIQIRIRIRIKVTTRIRIRICIKVIRNTATRYYLKRQPSDF